MVHLPAYVEFCQQAYTDWGAIYATRELLHRRRTSSSAEPASIDARPQDLRQAYKDAREKRAAILNKSDLEQKVQQTPQQ